ncbi:ABC transporter ATP-binding protein [Streptomyces sp. ST2-7A]|uniref:ABC transporter ATP-binding protein n=1 Tax=Streptomyces sp. ST2-7A TaxID=2907214 RepID=UPI001F333B3A|nr:ATP-binding cassette domain-containing protein [Streptomyces sp. ST2-7A]MCE7078683.1 ATP-binding cassette domain-containing protein [Streptomyces sp. ST2-7A]
MKNENDALVLESVTKSFPVKHAKNSTGDSTVLNSVSLRLCGGDLVWLRGPSGTGKTTLLSISGLLAWPDSGKVYVTGENVSDLVGAKAASIRRRSIGFVFQKPTFLPALNILENVLLPSVDTKLNAHDRAIELLENFGLQGRLSHRPALLSGGEAQRAALARALINEPPLILADEPTAGLDTSSGEVVRRYLTNLATGGRAVLVASHDEAFADHATHTLELRDGKLVKNMAREAKVRSDSMLDTEGEA